MTTYTEVTQWLFSQVPVFQHKGAAAYKPGLDKITDFVNYLGNPHLELEMIHVGGTNGKGSTSHMISACLQEVGCKVGLYTSPHLLDFSERIKINKSCIHQDFVIDFVVKHKDFFLHKKLSFFEITFGMALSYFEQEGVDYAVIEVGLGGRLDATNIINPRITAITNIGLDHTEFLGNTRAAIAFEKAGIIKAGVPIVIGEVDEVTRPIFQDKANQVNAPIDFIPDLPTVSITTDLRGSYQVHNLQTAYSVLKRLLSEQELNRALVGLSRVVAQTGLRGRWEKIGTDPEVIADVTHNFAGFKEVVEQLSATHYEQLHLVLGFVKGKLVADILDLLPSSAHFYFCSPGVERAFPLRKLSEIAKEKGLSFGVYDSVDQAYNEAKFRASPNDFIYIGGSTFVIAEILS